MHIVIIGNGISGITAARFIRKLSEHRVTVISSESKYFFARTALMYVYMGHMQLAHTKPYEDWFWEKNRIELIQDNVEKILFSDKQLNCRSGQTITYDKLIIAVGSKPNRFGWPGQDLEGVGGLYTLQDLERMEMYSRHLARAVVVGGGLIGIEMAEMFHSRNIPVTMLVRERSYWDMVLPPAESEMVNREIRQNQIDLRLETELSEIIGNDQGSATQVITNRGEKIDCGFVGLTTGVSPNIGWLRDTQLETDRGILVNEHLETNLPDVYAIGDCAQLRDPDVGRRAIEAVWYTGRIQGETIAYHICNQRTAYHPGIWFNSAKFFNIEFQVYGDVQPETPDHHADVYWEDASGKRSVRLVFERPGRTIVGFLTMGTRFRQEVCEKWIQERAPIERILSQLPLASFDPETTKQFHEEIILQYEKAFGKQVPIRGQRKWDQVFTFLRNTNSAK